MSRLADLIEQAKKTHRVNEMFRAQTSAFSSTGRHAPQDSLISQLTTLEQTLFDSPNTAALPKDDIICELELIASYL